MGKGEGKKSILILSKKRTLYRGFNIMYLANLSCGVWLHQRVGWGERGRGGGGMVAMEKSAQGDGGKAWEPGRSCRILSNAKKSNAQGAYGIKNDEGCERG